MEFGATEPRHNAITQKSHHTMGRTAISSLQAAGSLSTTPSVQTQFFSNNTTTNYPATRTYSCRPIDSRQEEESQTAIIMSSFPASPDVVTMVACNECGHQVPKGNLAIHQAHACGGRARRPSPRTTQEEDGHGVRQRRRATPSALQESAPAPREMTLVMPNKNTNKSLIWSMTTTKERGSTSRGTASVYESVVLSSLYSAQSQYRILVWRLSVRQESQSYPRCHTTRTTPSSTTTHKHHPLPVPLLEAVPCWEESWEPREPPCVGIRGWGVLWKEPSVVPWVEPSWVVPLLPNNNNSTRTISSKKYFHTNATTFEYTSPTQPQWKPCHHDNLCTQRQSHATTTVAAGDPILAFLMANGMQPPHQHGGMNIDNMTYEQLLERFGDGSSEHRGADEQVISSLPVSQVTHNASSSSAANEDYNKCSICLEQFQTGDQRKTLPCLHGFHDACVDKWLRTNASCPICKHVVSL